MYYAVVRGVNASGTTSWSGVVEQEALAAAAVGGAPRGASSYFVCTSDKCIAEAIVGSETRRARVSPKGPLCDAIRPLDVVAYTDGGCANMGHGVLRLFPPPSRTECASRNIMSIWQFKRDPNKRIRKKEKFRAVPAAGYGVWFGEGFPLNCGEPLEGSLQTSTRAEIRAIVAALEIIVSEKLAMTRVVIRMDAPHTDAREKIMRYKELAKWQPVANIDLWLRMDKALLFLDEKRIRVSFEWVKAHADSYGNYCADTLATCGIFAKASHINPAGQESCRARRPFLYERQNGSNKYTVGACTPRRCARLRERSSSPEVIDLCTGREEGEIDEYGDFDNDDERAVDSGSENVAVIVIDDNGDQEEEKEQENDEVQVVENVAQNTNNNVRQNRMESESSVEERDEDVVYGYKCLGVDDTNFADDAFSIQRNPLVKQHRRKRRAQCEVIRVDDSSASGALDCVDLNAVHTCQTRAPDEQQQQQQQQAEHMNNDDAHNESVQEINARNALEESVEAYLQSINTNKSALAHDLASDYYRGNSPEPTSDAEFAASVCTER